MKLMMKKRSVPHVRNAFVGKRVFLRPSTIDDYETVLMWQESADPQRLRQTIEPIMPVSQRLAEYTMQLKNPNDPTLADLTVVSRRAEASDEGIVGMLSYRSLNLLNRSARIEVCGDPEVYETAELSEALGLLIGYLFYQFNLNSVYAEVSELNTQALEVFETLKFKRDGILRQRHFFDGTFHNIRAYSLLRFESPN
jgi:RimJ/RimL family protein N-acetyltransferase